MSIPGNNNHMDIEIKVKDITVGENLLFTGDSCRSVLRLVNQPPWPKISISRHLLLILLLIQGKKFDH